MKTVYDIKISDLKELLNVLKDFYHEPMVQMDILRLSSYIERYERNFTYERVSIYERLLEDADGLKFYKPYYPFSYKFAAIGRKQEELSFDASYSPIILSDEEAMKEADLFFKEQGDFFYSSFQDFSLEATDHLKFIDIVSETSGETLTLKSTGEAFVFVPNYSNITKFTILVHEMEHALDFFVNPEFLGYHVVSETAAIFMELIASDFIAKKYSLYDDNFQRRNFIHTLTKSQATILKDKVKLLDFVNKYRQLDEEKLFSILRKKDFSQEDIEFFLEATITQDSSYQIPYLIAVELYVIYHHNKKLALNILQDIILNANNHNILEILNKYNIVLNKNILLYEDSLYKKITL